MYVSKLYQCLDRDAPLLYHGTIQVIKISYITIADKYKYIKRYISSNGWTCMPAGRGIVQV